MKHAYRHDYRCSDCRANVLDLDSSSETIDAAVRPIGEKSCLDLSAAMIAHKTNALSVNIKERYARPLPNAVDLTMNDNTCTYI